MVAPLARLPIGALYVNPFDEMIAVACASSARG
jgi:hypothetical protein